MSVQRELRRGHRANAPIRLACEGMNFVWKIAEIECFREWWSEGVPIPEIAELFGRPRAEVIVLAADQLNAKKIRKRAGGVLGI